MADDFDPLSRSDSLHDQMEEALRSLTGSDKLQLFRCARVLARGLGCEGHDLLQEARIRMLSGSWRWEKDTFKTNLISVMRSVASTWRDSQRSRGQREARFVAENPATPILLEHPPRQRERLERLRAQLLEREDESGFLLVEALLEGKSYEEARKDVGIDAGQPFNTLMRRLRRQIERL